MIHNVIPLHEGRTDVTLTTYVNTHSSELVRTIRRPAILICPGGAYIACSDAEGEPVAMAFNAMGYQAFVLRYSTYMESMPDDPMDIDADPPVKTHCLFPKPMRDIQLAMETLIKYQDEWRIDPKQIVICGFSAGAHNCGMYSVLWKEWRMPKPVAAILCYPLADFRMGINSSLNVAMHVAIAGKQVLTEEDMDQMSILKHIDVNTPPMFIWNTAEDEMVPCVNALAIATELSKNHIPFELHTFERGNHGLSTANPCSAVLNGQICPDVSVWVSLAHTWLKKRLNIRFKEESPFSHM